MWPIVSLGELGSFLKGVLLETGVFNEEIRSYVQIDICCRADKTHVSLGKITMCARTGGV